MTYFFHKQLVLVGTALVLSLCFFGCITKRNAVSKVVKAERKDKIGVADWAAKKYPIIENTKTDTIINSKDYDSISNAFKQYERESDYYIATLQKQIGAALASNDCAKKDDIINKLDIELQQQRQKCKELASAPKPITTIITTNNKESSATLEVMQMKAMAQIQGLEKTLNAERNEKFHLQSKIDKAIADKENAEKGEKRVRKNYYILWLLIVALVAVAILRKYIKSKMFFLK